MSGRLKTSGLTLRVSHCRRGKSHNDTENFMIRQSNDTEEGGGSCAPLGGSTSWVKGEAPLKRILMLWNGKGLFGPVAFQNEGDRENYCQHLEDLTKTVHPIPGRPTHYLIIPKCE